MGPELCDGSLPSTKARRHGELFALISLICGNGRSSTEDSGNEAMDAIRKHFAEMKDEETRLLRERVASTTRAYTTAMFTKVAAAL